MLPLAMILAAIMVGASEGAAQSPPPDARLQHVMDSLRAAPRGSGIMVAMVRGNPAATTGTIEMLIRLDAGAWIDPHRHNVAKEVRVLEGVILMGHGAVRDTLAVVAHQAGTRTTVPAEQAHYEGAREPTFILIVAPAPFTTTFLQ